MVDQRQTALPEGDPIRMYADLAGEGCGRQAALPPGSNQGAALAERALDIAGRTGSWMSSVRSSKWATGIVKTTAKRP